jgi:hypothetical protein
MPYQVHVTQDSSCCLQITLKGGSQQMRGSDNGLPTRPDFRVTMANTSAEQVIRVFGTVTGSTITSIGFITSRGTTNAPFGPGPGEPFSVDGLLLGFYGALENGAISGIGVWSTPMGGPNPWPGPVPLPLIYLEMSPAYGNLSNVAMWDDTTPDMGGAHIFSPPLLQDPRHCAGQDLPFASFPPRVRNCHSLCIQSVQVHNQSNH